MDADRRTFLKGTAWMGVLAAASGCATKNVGSCAGRATMQGFKVAPIKLPIKIGIVGVGRRAMGAVKRLSSIPA